MASSDIADHFNDPQYADMAIVLTTEPLDVCRARIDGDRERAPLQPAAPGLADIFRAFGRDLASAWAVAAGSSEPDAKERKAQGGPPDQWEVVYGHRCILCPQSPFFRGAHSFKRSSAPTMQQVPLKQLVSSGQENVPAADDQTGLGKMVDAIPSSNIVIFPSLTPAAIASHKSMLRFMYTKELHEGMQLSEVVDLLHLADYALVSGLQLCCLQRLAAVQFADCEQPQQHAILSALPSAMSATATKPDGPCRLAAAALKDGVLAFVVQQFEAEFWQSVSNRERWMQLPREFVLEVLQRGDLGVRSESTALVAALSWLQGPEGRQLAQLGTEDGLRQRREVLEAVRLLQLEPWFCSFLQIYAPESKQLLGTCVLQTLALYLGCSDSTRVELQQSDERLKLWATPRQGAKPALATISVSCQQAHALEVMQRMHASGKDCLSMATSASTVFSCGFDHQAGLLCELHAGQQGTITSIWGGVFVNLWIGGANIAGAALAPAPAKLSMAWGGEMAIKAYAFATGFKVAGHGFGLRELCTASGQGAQHIPQHLLDGDNVVFNATLGAVP